MTTVISHFPRRYVRHRELYRLPMLHDLAPRVLEALARGHCKPTIESVMEHFERSKHIVEVALRSLSRNGLLRRWCRSVGKDRFEWFAVVTDEPFAWDADEDLKDRIARVEAEKVEAARARLGIYKPTIEVPPAEDSRSTDRGDFSQVLSSPVSPEPTNKDLPGDLKENLPAVDNLPVDKSSDTFAMRLTRLFGAKPELSPYMADALALLAGLGFPPLTRANYGIVVAEALRSGRSLGAMTRFLTQSMASARSVRAVQKTRLDRLRAVLSAERAARRG